MFDYIPPTGGLDTSHQPDHAITHCDCGTLRDKLENIYMTIQILMVKCIVISYYVILSIASCDTMMGRVCIFCEYLILLCASDE